MNEMIGRIEVQQASEDAELWVLCIHDGVQWVQLGPPADVCELHDSADRLRRIIDEIRTRPA